MRSLSPWRRQLAVAVLLPVVVVAAVLAFAWPAARIAPRDLPLGVVGTGPASQRAADGLTRGGFDLRLYADQKSAESAIGHRDIYGAVLASPAGITILEASAASTSVAQALTSAGQRLAGGQAASIRVVDTVPTSSNDPRGVVLSSALLPLTICSIIMAAAIMLLMRIRPAWQQIAAAVVLSAVAGLGAYLIAQGFLGALPHEPVASWAALSLMLLAIIATTAGFIALVGTAGLAPAAVLMVFVGNPFSGVTSAPQLLPEAVNHIGQWLPPGAGANLLRSTAYFGGHGAGGHVAVLLAWTVFGLAAVLLGPHMSISRATHPGRPSLMPARARHNAAPTGDPTRV
jgi:hypothetical protein